MDGITAAILRGQLTVNLPVMAIILVPPAAMVWWFPTPWLLVNLLLVVVVFLVGFAAGWWFWSKRIPQWRLRAFSDVPEENWLPLYRAAIRYKLIWPSGHEFEKTEIRTIGAAEQLTIIDERLYELQQVEMISDHFTTPKEVTYLPYRPGAIWYSIFLLILLGGCYGIVAEGIIFWQGWFAILIGGYLLVTQFRYLKAAILNLPVLVLKEEEVSYSLRLAFRIDWTDITSIEFTEDYNYLEIIYKDGEKLKKGKVDLACVKFGNREKLLRTFLTFWDRSEEDYWGD